MVPTTQLQNCLVQMFVLKQKIQKAEAIDRFYSDVDQKIF